MSTDKQSVKNYYDDVALRKLSSFLKPNLRVESAWATLIGSIGKPRRILEVGCGVGDITFRLSRHFPNADVTGLDISPRSIEIANKVFGGSKLNFVAGEINAVAEKEFDVVVMMDVFEHIDKNDREGFMCSIRDCIATGAFVFGSCPTPEFLAWLKVNSPQHIQPIDEDITIDVIADLARVTGLRLIMYKTVSIWFSGDYFHFLLGPQHSIKPVAAVSSKQPNRLKEGVKMILLGNKKKIPANDLTAEDKLALIRLRMGDEFTRELQKLL
jgi:SAM-dependent methyltransferase